MTNTEITAGLRQMADDMGCAMAPAGYYADEIALLGMAADLIDSMPAGSMTTNTNAAAGVNSLLALLIDEYAEARHSKGHSSYNVEVSELRQRIDAALSAAAQPPAGICVPTELAERVQETMGEFLMDHGWRQQDMDTSDEFGALLAVATKAESAEAGKKDRS